MTGPTESGYNNIFILKHNSNPTTNFSQCSDSCITVKLTSSATLTKHNLILKSVADGNTMANTDITIDNVYCSWGDHVLTYISMKRD